MQLLRHTYGVGIVPGHADRIPCHIGRSRVLDGTSVHERYLAYSLVQQFRRSGSAASPPAGGSARRGLAPPVRPNRLPRKVGAGRGAQLLEPITASAATKTSPLRLSRGPPARSGEDGSCHLACRRDVVPGGMRVLWPEYDESRLWLYQECLLAHAVPRYSCKSPRSLIASRRVRISSSACSSKKRDCARSGGSSTDRLAERIPVLAVAPFDETTASRRQRRAGEGHHQSSPALRRSAELDRFGSTVGRSGGGSRSTHVDRRRARPARAAPGPRFELPASCKGKASRRRRRRPRGGRRALPAAPRARPRGLKLARTTLG